MFPVAHGIVSQGGVVDAPPPTPNLGGPSWYGQSSQTQTSSASQLGVKFTVGANDVTVTHLRLLSVTGTSTEIVRLWRVTDQTLLASAEVTATDGIGETEIEPLVLEAGQSYAITHRPANGASRPVWRQPIGLVVDPAITLDNGVSGGSGNSYPSSSLGVTWYAQAHMRTAAEAGKHRFYRLMVDAYHGGSHAGTSTLEFATEAEGADLAQAIGGTAYAESVHGPNVPARAFDGNTGTGWGVASTSDIPTFLQWDFGTGREQSGITHYRVGAFYTDFLVPARSFRDWRLQASNDLENWSTLDTVTGEEGWTFGEVREYAV